MTSVHELRKQGHKVMVQHKRRYFDPVNKRWSFLTKYEKEHSNLPDYVIMSEKGGMTVVKVNIDGVEHSDVAVCSKKDSYDKKFGIKVALGRVLNSVVEIKNV